jgi:hypothetical protein
MTQEEMIQKIEALENKLDELIKHYRTHGHATSCRSIYGGGETKSYAVEPPQDVREISRWGEKMTPEGSEPRTLAEERD